jgi:SAM-dependent methyltransferase
MESKQPTVMDLIIEAHIGLERQGPGSSEVTLQALSFIGTLDADSRVLDLGCGTGGQTLVLAHNTNSNITGLDIIPDFIGVFNDIARQHNYQDRMRGIVGSMDDLCFEKESFDLIWSEGAIDNIGFDKGINYWTGFLKQSGYVAVTCPSWLTDQRPDEIEEFWGEAVGGLGTVAQNTTVMLDAGYRFIAAFTLPEKCWTEGYFTPREAANNTLLSKYPNDTTVKSYIATDECEVELFSKYNQHYSYVFYIGQKL